MFWRIRTLIVKEFLAVWRDLKSRFILLAPPLLELVVFAFAATQEVRNVAVGILNHDPGTAGRDLTARFEGSPNFGRIVYLGSEAEAARALDAGSVRMVLSIRDDFSAELEAGRPTTVQLLLDGRRSSASDCSSRRWRGRSSRRSWACSSSPCPPSRCRGSPAPWRTCPAGC